MANIQDLLNQAASYTPPNLSSDKQAAVAAASDQKKQMLSGMPDMYQVAAGMGNQIGAMSMGDVEKDLRTLSNYDLIMKYGPDQASLLRGNLAKAQAQFSADQTATRDTPIWDTASGVGTGFAGVFGDIAAWGGSVVNDDLGVFLSDKVHQARQAVTDSQSQGLTARRRANEAINSLDLRDNQAEYESDIANGASEFEAGLSKFGRDFVDTLSNASQDSMLFAQGTSEGLGSLLAGGPIARGVGAVGGALAKHIGSRAVVGPASLAAQRADKAVDALRWPIAVGAMEGGGAYGNTVSDIMNMSPEQLLETSEIYRQKVSEYQAQGMPLEEALEKAKIQLASETANKAALATATIAGPIGLLARYAEKPFKAESAAAAASNILFKEPTEEGAQGAGAQVMQNLAIKSDVDASRTWEEGAGEQAATGALYGLGAAGAVQGPGLAAKGTGAAVGSTARAIGKGFTALADAQENRTAQRDAENFAAQNTEANQIITNTPVVTETINQSIDSTEATPEAKDKAKAVVQTTFDALKVNTDQLDLDSANEDIVQAVSSANNVTEAIANVASVISQIGAARQNLPEERQAEVDAYQTSAAVVLTKLIGQLDSALAQDKSSLDILPSDSPVLEQYKNTVGFLETVRQHPTIKRELTKAQKLFNTTLDNVTEEQLKSPQAKQIVEVAVANASIAPEQGNLKTLNMLLNMSDDDGKPYIFSEGQKETLMVSRALIQAREDLAAMNEKAGNRSRLDVVDGQIFTRDKNLEKQAPKMSAVEFGTNILRHVQNKNLTEATKLLEEFGMFVEHMKNKVKAINEHYKDNGSKGKMNAKPIHYQALLPRFEEDGGWQFADSSTIQGHKGIYVAPNNAGSVGLSQAIADETQVLAQVFNQFVEAFPELGIAKAQAIPLATGLQGKVDEVVARHKEMKPSSSTGSSSATPTEIKNPAAITDWAQKNFKGEESRTAFVNKSDELRNAGRTTDADFVLEEFDRLTKEAEEAAKSKPPTNPRATPVATHEKAKKIPAKELTTFANRLLKVVGLGNLKLTVVTATSITENWTLKDATEETLNNIRTIADNMRNGVTTARMSVTFNGLNPVIIISESAKEYPEAGLFEVIAHEVGHIIEHKLFNEAPEKLREAVLDEYEKYVESVSGKDAAILIRLKRPGLVGDALLQEGLSKMTLEEMSAIMYGRVNAAGESYHLSFAEWHADQVARWALTSENTKGFLQTSKYFKKIADLLEKVYALLLDVEKLPPPAFEQYMNAFVEAAKGRQKVQTKTVTDVTKTNGFFNNTRKAIIRTASGTKEFDVRDLYFGDAFWDAVGIVVYKEPTGENLFAWRVSIPYLVEGGIGPVKFENLKPTVKNAKELLEKVGKKKFFKGLQATAKKEGVSLSEALLKAGGEIAVEDAPTPTPTPVPTPTPTPVPVTPTATSTSTTPVLDSLPERIPGKPTMLYAGVGSRKTPPAIQKAMAELAKRLEALGYTLRTGDAMGADQAFRNASGKKEVFTAKDVKGDPKALALVDELHPNISALKKIGQFAVDLMARNAYQIFGRKLDTPVDFVLVWTPDGVTTHKGRNQNTGGTGQAISLASLKGIPVINMAKDGWEAELEKVLNKPKTSSTPSPKKAAGELNTEETPTTPETTKLTSDQLTALSEKQIKALSDAQLKDAADTLLAEMTSGKKKDVFKEDTTYQIVQREIEVRKTIKEGVKAKFTAEQVAKFSDEKLEEEFTALLVVDVLSLQQEATFRILDAERTARKNNKPKGTTPAPKNETPKPEPEKKTEPVGFLQKIGKPIVDRIFRMFDSRVDKQGNNVSRLFAADSTTSSVQFVLNAIASPESIQKVLGRKPKFSTAPDILADYERLLSKYVPHFAQVANGRLNAYMTKVKIKTPEDLAKWSTTYAGKALNIVEDVDGTFQYNQDMLEAAVMAAVQWIIESSGHESQMDEEQAEKLVGKKVDELTKEQINKLRQGFSEEQIKFGIASKIAQYWGLKGKSDARLGYADGITEALAGELVQVLIQGKFIGSLDDTAVIFRSEETGKEISRVNRYVPTQQLGKLVEYPSLIEEMILTEPEEMVYLGGDKPPIAKTKINSGGVRNSETQMKAMEAQQEDPFFQNVTGVGALLSMGVEGALSLFANGTLGPKESYNENHFESMEGQNASISNAYLEMQNMLAKVASRAKAMGTTPDKVEVRYAINVTKNGRYQMLGRYTPQASKLMRIVFMATWSTLNLEENRAHARNFNIAIAQAFGQKVHRQRFGKIEEEVTQSLQKLDAVAQEALLAWLSDQSKPFPTAIIKQAFTEAGVELTPAAFNAYVEYTRTKMPDVNKKAFQTSLSLEADGITNGPLNALMLLSIGKITPEFIMNLRRGGIFLGESIKTYDSFEGNDIYLNSAEAMQESIGELSTALNKFPKAREQHWKLLQVMRVLLPNYIESTYDDNQNLVLKFKRNLLKNPLTVILYGSSPNGIAGKITGELLDAFYEKASKAAKDGVNPAEAFFPGYANPQRNYELLISLMNDLTHQNMTHWVDRKSMEDKYGVKENERKVPSRKHNEINFKTLTFTKAEYESIRANILVGMVEPMVEGIRESLGSDIFTAMDQIKDATQYHSSIYAMMFQARVNEIIKNREPDEEGKAKSSWLSQKELNAIARELRPFFPMLETDDHSIVMMKEKPLSSKAISYSRTFDDKMRTAPRVFFPASVGVGGIPYTVIGYADAAMIMRAAVEGTLNNTLPVHDGVEMPLDKVAQISSGLNKAVYDSTMQNPMRHIQEMFSKLLENDGVIQTFLLQEITFAREEFVNQDHIKENYPELYSIFATAGMYPFSDKENEWTNMSNSELVEQVIAAMQMLSYSLQDSADIIDARHQAISEVAASYDHMASAHVGYHNGKPTLSTTDPTAIAEHLQKRVDEIKEDKQKAQEDRLEQLGNLGLEHPTGAHILRGNDYVALAKGLNASHRTIKLLKHLSSVLKNKPVTVVMGSKDQINTYRKSIGQPILSDADLKGLHGQTVFSETGAVIYLMNASSETILHELIHAATFQVISDYFSGKAVSENAAIAIQNLQALMEQFMNMPVSNDVNVNRTIGRIRNVVKEHLAKGEKAEALNEFMAWSLANEGVFKELDGRKTQNGFFKTLAKNIITAIENLLKITFKDTLGSQLVFNTAVLFNQDTTPDTWVSLNHQSAPVDSRLSQIRGQLDANVLSKLKERMDKVNAGDMTIDLSVDAEEANRSLAVADRIAQVFNLNEEQRVTMITLMMATSTLGSLDSSVMTRIQELYDHALKNLTEADLADATTVDPVLREQEGIPRYALLTELNSATDAKGRSRLLPTFLALGIVDDNFRKALFNIAVPQNQKVPGKTLDAMLSNFGNSTMESLNKYLSLEKQPGNVQVALDQLIVNIQALSYREQSRVDKVSIKTNNFLSEMEDKLVAKKDELADKTKVLGDTQLNSSNPLRKAVGIGLSAVASLASSKVADEKARAIIENLNKFAGRGGLAKAIADSGIQKLITDMIGRTGDNFRVYDWIKPARTMVQQVRQQSRDDLPIIFAKKFSRELTNVEWSAMYKVIGRTDLAAFLTSKNVNDVLNLVVSKNARDTKIGELEEALSKKVPNNFSNILEKTKQLAHFMNTGIPGNDLHTNAIAIAELIGGQSFSIEDASGNPLSNREILDQSLNNEITKIIDQLATLYAVRDLPQEQKDEVASLIKTENDGVKFITDYLYQTRLDELNKINGTTKYNYRKGHMPSDQRVDGAVIVAPVADETTLSLLGYKKIGDYSKPSNDPSNERMAYYHSPVSQRAPVSQGIIQNVRHTVFGVDSYHGFSTSKTAGRIVDPKEVARLIKQMNQNKNPIESFIPIRNDGGGIVAFERTLDPKMLLPLQQSEHFGKMLGVWRGRQIEEAISVDVNNGVLDALKQMWFKDKGTSRVKEYINLKDPSKLTPVQRDMVKLFTPQFKNDLNEVFGDEGWYVRMDLVDDVIGYRNASVGDFFTGNSNWSPETQKVVKNMMLLLGDERAYRLLMGGEKRLQAFMSEARQTIVVKSVVIPMYNIMSNTLHLISRGVPLHMIIKGSLRKVAEIQQYAKSQVRLVELEAEIRAEKNELKRKQFEVERQAIKDSHTRLSIWPLIQAGEFSTIADVGMTADDLEVTSGKLTEWVENQVSKLPPALQTAARYGYISRDTALYRGLQKSVQYGDFVAKAILFDHLTQNKGKTEKEALAQITEEFVNYDRLPGRVRGSMENLGLLWFYNYKIRAVKVGLSVLRNNPLHAALAMAMPFPDSAGLPLEENLFGVAAEGNLPYSIGPSMALHAINLNPWVNIMN